jgi:ferredoxin
LSDRITRVWIEEGCISCKLCQDMAPDVFLVDDDQVCVVRADAGAYFASQADDIREAARDCPVEVIKLDEQ